MLSLTALLEGLDIFVKHAVRRLREHFRLVVYHVLRSRCHLVLLWLSELVECLAELLQRDGWLSIASTLFLIPPTSP
jgi:hypothetical protein